MTSRTRECMIDAPGARIYCKTIGSGPPLLLLHGGPGADHTDFLPYLFPLSRKRKLILVGHIVTRNHKLQRVRSQKRFTAKRP